MPYVYWAYGALATIFLQIYRHSLGELVNITPATFTFPEKFWYPFRSGQSRSPDQLIIFLNLIPVQNQMHDLVMSPK